MSIESNVKTIADLDQTLPAKSDYISEGDDHLRLIKHTVKQTFPNADTQLTSPFSELSKTTDYMEFKRDSNDTYNIIEFKDITQVKNAGNATEDKDLVTLGQIKTIINGLITEKLYKVGSYYISDSDVNPRIALGLPSTGWVQVQGFLAGVGQIAGTQAYNFELGSGHGDTSVRLQEGNLPRAGVDMSGVQAGAAGSGHTHGYQAYGHVSNGYHTGQGSNPEIGEIANARTDASSSEHTHQLSGTGYIGHDTPNPVSIIPSYTGVYIWRRIS